jgi:basic amino acid/polyamine antiporter, APA family
MNEFNHTESGAEQTRLKKQLGLWNVYCISTGAMFSSGFFLLPGLATAQAGASTILSYFIAGLMMIPAMFCMAELSTALPRAGGTYYYLDRSMGPAMGTIGGIGVWLSLVLKSGFALLGMGAYLAITPGVSSWMPAGADEQLWMIKALAVALTILFAAVNIMGAKETSRLQGMLVVAMLAVLALFVIQGLWYMFFRMPAEVVQEAFTPFFHDVHGLHGTFTTIGLVFVSYAGLTKVASVSEEVKQPERNLPLGMFLSLLTATTIYVLGVLIMVAVVDREALRVDYTPVATAAEAFFGWLPRPVGLLLIIVSALAAFASTANAGILSSSRYPMAMARDRLIHPGLSRLGRFHTPTAAILVTSGAMIFFILFFSAEGIAKLASSFNLLVFAMIGLAVLVMRESRIESYDPGFRCPGYPWTPFLAIVISVLLIMQMGWMAGLFPLGVVVAGACWYAWYGRTRAKRAGAIYHIFARLGQRRFEGLDEEFRQIIKEKGLRQDDPFEDLITQSAVIDAKEGISFEALVNDVAEILRNRLPLSKEEICEQFLSSSREGRTPVAHGLALPHFRVPGLAEPELVMVRSRSGIWIERKDDPTFVPKYEEESRSRILAFFFFVSAEENVGLHLRILSQIAGRTEQPDFHTLWMEAEDEMALKETLLRDERYISLRLAPDKPSAPLIGKTLSELTMPADTLIMRVRRENQSFVPHGRTRLQEGDLITIIGEPEGIASLYRLYKP